MHSGQNGRQFADDIFICFFLNRNMWISIKIYLKFVRKGACDDISALFQIMAWRLPDCKPSSEPMIPRSPTHFCVTRPQWVSNVLAKIRYVLNCCFLYLIVYKLIRVNVDAQTQEIQPQSTIPGFKTPNIVLKYASACGGITVMAEASPILYLSKFS